MVKDVHPGQIWVGNDELLRYVIGLEPAEGRRQAKVLWRRPGRFATKIFTQTITAFCAEVWRLSQSVNADPAIRLPNGGMATVEVVE